MNRSPPPTLCRRIGGRFRKPNAARSDESGAAAAVSRARRRAGAARRVAVGTDSLSVCAPHHQVPPHIRAIPPGAALVRRRLRTWAAPLVYAQDSMRRMPPAGRGGNIGFHDICPPLIHARPPRSLIPSGVVGHRDGPAPPVLGLRAGSADGLNTSPPCLCSVGVKEGGMGRTFCAACGSDE